ncbi:hypothetical protein J2W14_001569 [Pseudarthrobacter oxydans]|nr:hypothetical protein [Pseudarthrobacter oxydans]MDP9982181.1 hypothetical protein [Pseudarthrobacter oxydans]
MSLAIAAGAFVFALIAALSTRLQIAPTSDRPAGGAAAAALEPEGSTLG